MKLSRRMRFDTARRRQLPMEHRNAEFKCGNKAGHVAGVCVCVCVRVCVCACVCVCVCVPAAARCPSTTRSWTCRGCRSASPRASTATSSAPSTSSATTSASSATPRPAPDHGMVWASGFDRAVVCEQDGCVRWPAAASASSAALRPPWSDRDHTMIRPYHGGAEAGGAGRVCGDI